MSKNSKTPEQTVPQADAGLSRKRRMALIVYLAILFIVALAVVTLSLVIQIHNNTEEYQGIAEKAYILQEENMKLKREKDAQISNYTALQFELEALKADAAEMQAENDALKEENETLKNGNDTLKKALERTQKAYDLLAASKTALDAEDEDAFRAAMDELAPFIDNLSEQAKAEYDALLSAMADHTPEP